MTACISAASVNPTRDMPQTQTIMIMAGLLRILPGASEEFVNIHRHAQEMLPFYQTVSESKPACVDEQASEGSRRSQRVRAAGAQSEHAARWECVGAGSWDRHCVVSNACLQVDDDGRKLWRVLDDGRGSLSGPSILDGVFIKDANTYACRPAACKNASAGPHPCVPSDIWMPRRFADAATARATFERATWIDEQTLLWPAGGRYFFYHTLADGVFPLWWLGLMGGRASWNGSKDSTDRRVFVHTPPQEEPVLSPHSLWSELWESVSQFPPLTTAAGRTPLCAPDQKSDAAVRADKRKYEAIFETVGDVTCFRELVVGSGTQTINQNSRFGHVNTKPDAFDAACHPYHVIAWSRFMKRALGTHAAVPVPRFNGKVVFANRGSNLNRVIADTKGSVSAALAAAKNWRSDATVDEFLFESLSAKETAARISNVSVLIVPAGAGIFNAMFLPAGAAVVVVFQRGTSACFWHQFMGVLADMGVLPVACAPDSGGPQPKDCHGWKGNELHHAKRGGEKLINLAPDVLRGCVDEAISKMVATERVPNRRTRYRAPPMLNETVGFPERALAFWNREPLRSQPVEYCNAFQAVSSKPPDASMDPPEKLNGFKGLKNTRGIKCADHRRKS